MKSPPSSSSPSSSSCNPQDLDMGNFHHFSGDIIEKLRLSSLEEDKYTLKPRNNVLWFSRKYEWINWCKKSDFFPQKYRYRYKIKNYEGVDMSKILIIHKTREDINNFREKYSKHFIIDEDENMNSVVNLDGIDREKYGVLSFIDWNKVRSEYSGIYLPSLKINECEKYHVPFDLMGMFCSLDVDSLAIWGTDILELELIETNLNGFGWEESDLD